jgi:hypothetical protein
VSHDDAALIGVVDELEARAAIYVTLEQVAAAAPGQDLPKAIAAGLLLVDYRTLVDGTPVTLCRLNRRHPLVVRLTAW